MKRLSPIAVTTASHTVLAAILCFVPLFNLLGYEFCFATSLLAAITGVVLGMTWPIHHRPLLASVFQAGLLSILQLIPGLLLICGNALRVRNCDFVAGFEFFALLPIPTALYGTTVGLAANRLFPKLRTAKKFGLGAALLLTPLFGALWGLYSHPPIFVWDHLWSYFAGSIYDEGIQADSRLILFRGITLSRIIVIIVALSLWEAKNASILKKAFLPFLLLVALWGIENSVGPKWGFGIQHSDILEELSQTVEVPGMVIHLPTSLAKSKVKALVEDHQFNLEYLLGVLDLPRDSVLNNPIHSFVYSDSNHKGRWMGGKNTMVAKPWLNEIHIHGANFPHTVLPHELVHVLAGQFGSRLLGVSARYEFGVNLALIEGLAEALTPPTTAVDLDHYAKAMRTLKLAPDLRTLLSPTGFWQQSPRRAYTIAGSFVNYLLKEYGIQKFKDVYPRGDFEPAYGKPLESLVGEWESQIDKLPLPEKYKRDAQERFKRPSIFERPCAHVIYSLRREARGATPCHAVELQQAIVGHLGQSPSALVDLAQAYMKADRKDEFFALSKKLLSEGKLANHLRIKLLELQGNGYWKQNKISKATNAFENVLQSKLNPSSKRLQWVRLWALRQPPELGEFIRSFLERAIPIPAAVIHLMEFSEKYPEESTFSYLLARQLHNSKAYEEAIEFLQPSLTHPNPEIAAESLRLIADCYWNRGDENNAREYYQRYREQAPTTGEAARAQIWIERINWKFSEAKAD